MNFDIIKENETNDQIITVSIFCSKQEKIKEKNERYTILSDFVCPSWVLSCTEHLWGAPIIQIKTLRHCLYMSFSAHT